MDDDAKTMLGQPLDPSIVKARQGGEGRMVSYLEGYVIIDQLNRIFGFDGWGYETLECEMLNFGEFTDSDGNLRQKNSYRAKVRLEVRGCPNRTDIGWTTVIYDTSDGHDMAVKGAVTDALKRAARTFGAQFGNVLYDKDEPWKASPPAPAARPAAPTQPVSRPATPVPAASQPPRAPAQPPQPAGDSWTWFWGKMSGASVVPDRVASIIGGPVKDDANNLNKSIGSKSLNAYMKAHSLGNVTACVAAIIQAHADISAQEAKHTTAARDQALLDKSNETPPEEPPHSADDLPF